MADPQRDDLQADPGPLDTGSTEENAAKGGSEPTPAAVGEPAVPPAPAAEGPAPALHTAPAQEEAAAAPTPPAAGEPTLEASTTVPAVGASGPATAQADAQPHDDGSGDGGEWNLLLEKLRQWWGSGELQSLWRQAKTPLTLALAVVGLLLVLRVYSGLVSAINGLPLVPGLLELAGLIWTLRYGLPKLLRRSERQQLLEGLQQRWRNFSGRG
ncbi:MAG: CAAD domain-containing protein [Cyanobacteria bacterium J06638_7]